MSRSVRTTTLLVQKPEDFETLKSRFKLISYEIPYKYKVLKGNKKFQQLHIAFKEQIKYPYYAHTPKSTLYVLYPHGDAVKPIRLEFLSSTNLLTKEIDDLTTIPLHVIIKLMFADYFRQPNLATFLSQGAYYIYVMPVKYKGIHRSDKCLEIKVSGHRHNIKVEYPEYESFQITGSAKRFAPVDKSKIKDWQKKTKPFFKKTNPQNGLVFFSQLRVDEIDNYDEEVYEIKPPKEGRTRIHYHFHSKPEKSRGKILFDFINSFIRFLSDAGFKADQQYRSVTEYKPDKSDANFIDQLENVFVYDNRLISDIPISDYVELLSQRLTSTP